MAFSQTAQTGFGEYGRTTGDEEFLLPGDPGVSFVAGDLCALNRTSLGVLIKATDSLPPPYFRVTRSTVCPAATQAFPLPADSYRPAVDAEGRTLIPVTRVGAVANQPILRVKTYGYVDETVTSYTASTRVVVLGTGMAVNDYSNGGLVYVYEGPGIGEMNIIEDYVHASTHIVLHRAFATALTTASKLLIYCKAAGDNAVGPFGRMDVYDADQLDVTDGSDDGNFIFWGGWEMLGEMMKNGHVSAVQYNVE
jgi:hypothetical protein